MIMLSQTKLNRHLSFFPTVSNMVVESACMIIRDLLHQELGQLFTIEICLEKVLLKTAESVEQHKFQRVLRRHFGEIRKQQESVKNIGNMLGFDIQEMPCLPVQELINDLGQVAISPSISALKDAILANKLRLIKNYQIIGYGTACQYAQKLGDMNAGKRLGAIRQDEMRLELTFRKIAVNCLCGP